MDSAGAHEASAGNHPLLAAERLAAEAQKLAGRPSPATPQKKQAIRRLSAEAGRQILRGGMLDGPSPDALGASPRAAPSPLSLDPPRPAAPSRGGAAPARGGSIFDDPPEPLRIVPRAPSFSAGSASPLSLTSPRCGWQRPPRARAGASPSASPRRGPAERPRGPRPRAAPSLDLDPSRRKGNFVFDRRSRLWYNGKTKFYYQPKKKLYARRPEGPWLRLVVADGKKLVPAEE